MWIKIVLNWSVIFITLIVPFPLFLYFFQILKTIWQIYINTNVLSALDGKVEVTRVWSQNDTLERLSPISGTKTLGKMSQVLGTETYGKV